MVTTEQWRARIGSFRCRGVKEEEEDVNDRFWRWMDRSTPCYSKRYTDNCDDFVKDVNQEKSGNHETVTEDELLRSGVEPNPGPGPSWQMVCFQPNVVECR